MGLKNVLQYIAEGKFPGGQAIGKKEDIRKPDNNSGLSKIDYSSSNNYDSRRYMYGNGSSTAKKTTLSEQIRFGNSSSFSPKPEPTNYLGVDDSDTVTHGPTNVVGPGGKDDDSTNSHAEPQVIIPEPKPPKPDNNPGENNGGTTHTPSNSTGNEVSTESIVNVPDDPSFYEPTDTGDGVGYGDASSIVEPELEVPDEYSYEEPSNNISDPEPISYNPSGYSNGTITNNPNYSGYWGDTSSDGYGYTISFNGREYKSYEQGVGNYINDFIYGANTSNSIINFGCGLTTLATVASGHGYTQNPGEFLQIEKFKNATASSEVGWNTQLAAQYESLGFNVEIDNTYNHEYYENVENIKNWLSSGGEISFATNGAIQYVGGGCGSSAGNGHWVAIIGISDDGNKVYVCDPGNQRDGEVCGDGWATIDAVLSQAYGTFIKVKKD